MTRSFSEAISFIRIIFLPVRQSAIAQKKHSHSFTELRVREIEVATHVPKKFRFPFFKKFVMSNLFSLDI